MKIQNTFLVGLMAIAGLSSCVSEDFKTAEERALAEKGMGIMKLDVSLLQPESTTRSREEVIDFPVEVVSEDGSYNVTYPSVADVPASVELPVGNYTVKSHTAGVCGKKRTTPYYEGSKTMEIQNGVTTNVEVVCKMKNSHISVVFGSEMDEVYESWSVTLDDGSETVLSFSNESSRTDYYWLFEENVKGLTMNFVGVLAADETTVRANALLTKSSSSTSYGDDSDNFSGGDALVIKVKPLPASEITGKVTGISITAEITFTDTGKTETLDVTDADSDDNQGGNNPQPGDEFITLRLPNDMVVSPSTPERDGDTYIKAPAGLKSIMVKITGSDAMMASLAGLATNYNVDFRAYKMENGARVDLPGAEIVDSKYVQQEGELLYDEDEEIWYTKRGAWPENPTTYSVEKIFVDLYKVMPIPTKGDTEYTFPIGSFFGLLAVLPGDHTFYLTITDMEGHTKDGVLVLTVK